VVLFTADHGNADRMYEPDGSAFTAHTTNPVPLIIAGLDTKVELLPPGAACLADLAPTILHIMGIPQPEEMTGRSIIV
jgi:2,3-bisphosphoglycerate-independent phosphoglycerate mutase